MMLNRNEVDKIRRKTIMSEAYHVSLTSAYQSIRDNARLKLKFLQEEYKAAFGEYAEEFLIKENLNESEELNENETPNWEVSSAKRKDGVVFNIGDSFTDANDSDSEIEKMWIADNGKLMAKAKGGGAIDLFNVSVKKFNGDK